MTTNGFPICLPIILKEEGSNDDDPHDHGGRTSRGIIQREWDIWRKTHPNLPDDVWQAPQDQVDAIYKQQYWNPYCDSLPAGVDLCFFNASVNSGRTQAARELQRALGVSVDGMVGMETMQAANSASNVVDLIHRMSEQRRAFYRVLKQFPRYGRGWLARTDRVENAAHAMAPATPVAPTVSVSTASPKADPESTATPPISVSSATSGTAAASVASGISDQLQSLSTALSPMAETLHWVKIGCIVIAVICAGLVIYAVIHNKKIAAVT